MIRLGSCISEDKPVVLEMCKGCGHEAHGLGECLRNGCRCGLYNVQVRYSCSHTMLVL